MGGSEVCALTSAQPACWWGLCPDQPAWLHTHPGPFISPSCPAHHGRSLTPLQRPEQSPNTQPGHVGPFRTHTRMHGTIGGSGLCVHLDWCATLGPACILGMSGWLPLGGLSEGGVACPAPPRAGALLEQKPPRTRPTHQVRIAHGGLSVTASLLGQDTHRSPGDLFKMLRI